MKKEKLISALNWILVFAIPAVVATTDIKTKSITSTYDVKNLNTSLFRKAIEVKEKNVVKDSVEANNEDSHEKQQNNSLESQKNIEKEDVKESKKESIEMPVQEVVKQEEKQEISVEKEDTNKSIQNVENYSGKVSYYRANCYGCGGYTSSGLDISDGKLYYNDSTYGNVRIVAAGREIPLYSIVKLTNTSLGTINAIVLDRGGDIGSGRKFIIDILTNTSENKGGVDYGVSVEVVRKGK